ncbi:MAG: hypothetical protein A4E53_04002 [Pelotomaculum sp. PtaB.Bin104]|nr:MAG: hypothetical protein A4E53_04002 [Pelotomaculum sp. PtaB.Bin104]
MKEVSVTVFGTNGPKPTLSCCEASSAGACCDPAKTMQEQGEELKEKLVKNFGPAIQYTYVDVLSNEMKNYPEIAPIMVQVNLPLIVINGQPRFQGGISNDRISEAVSELGK